jgi:nucleoside-diphosphate-sugar epimerase
MAQQRIALVLGATGKIGGEVAKGLRKRGWHVRALHRNPADLPERDRRFDWIRGDAMMRNEVAAAAQGAELIVHAVNPPGYRNWGGLVLPMLDNSIAAARANRARILLPGTVYNYGPDTFPLLREEAPQQPLTRKGAIRVEMERSLQAATKDGVRTLIVRAGDYFGPGSGNSWFAGAMVQPGKPITAINYPGTPGVGHQWAYLPDVAETMLRLLDREADLPDFASYNMQGHWDEDGTRMVAAIQQVAGRKLKLRAFPWWALPLLAPFSELMRELREMRYLWQQPVQLDNTRLTALLGQEPHTPWDEAVGATLRALRCI